MTQTIKTWSILDILKASEKALREKGIDNPRLNAEALLADTLNTERIKLYLDFDKPLKDSEVSSYRERIRRRLKHEPLQYIRGYTEFFGMRFNVNPSVLIPRQETELLVEKSIEIISGLNHPCVLEIGTGSGCIAAAVAAKTTCHIDAIDISDEALSVAKENTEANGWAGKISFINKNILADFENFNGYSVIISNPPYIASDEIGSLKEELKLYEPLEALTDNADGLTFYRKIFKLAKNSGCQLTILMEIGDGKKDIVEKSIIGAGFDNYEFHRDLMNIYRTLQINKS
jgi:release factor glutamine methyltransferase